MCPRNVVHEATHKLRDLKQTSSIRDYVREFTNLTLQILNLNNEDLLFNFLDDLQNWVKQELQRHQVKDVDEAIVVAESLTGFRTDNTKAKENHRRSVATKGDSGEQSKGRIARSRGRELRR